MCRNPTVLIRAIPRLVLACIVPVWKLDGASQSHCTDQGNSEGIADLGNATTRTESQSHCTDQGNSEGPFFNSFGWPTYNPLRRYPCF